MRIDDVLCILSALVNAIWVPRGAKTASLTRRKLSGRFNICGSVATVLEDIHALHIRLELCRVEDPETRHFESLPLILDRIFPVRLFCQNELDRTICVDTTTGLILNSSERYPLSLTTKPLFLCAEGDRFHSKNGEVRVLVNGIFRKR